MELYVIPLVALVVLIVVIFIVLIKKGQNILSDEQMDAWDHLADELKKDNFTITSKIEVESKEYNKKRNVYVPELVISVDVNSGRLALTSVTDTQKNEKGIITKYILGSKFIEFSTIRSGRIVEGGTSSSSVGTGVGTFNNGLAGGISTSTTSNYIYSLQYAIETDDMDDPIYMITFFNRQVDQSSPKYRRYKEAIIKLDTIIQKIAKENEGNK